jgi:hypothetical protein
MQTIFGFADKAAYQSQVLSKPPCSQLIRSRGAQDRTSDFNLAVCDSRRTSNGPIPISIRPDDSSKRD